MIFGTERVIHLFIEIIDSTDEKEKKNGWKKAEMKNIERKNVENKNIENENNTNVDR